MVLRRALFMLAFVALTVSNTFAYRSHNRTPKEVHHFSRNDADCANCIEFVDHVGDAMKNYSFHFKILLADVCRRTPLKKNHCIGVVNEVYDAILALSPKLYPKLDRRICTDVGMCPRKDLYNPGYYHLGEPKSNGWVCEFCKEFLENAYDLSGNQTILRQSQRFVDRYVCAQLPDEEDKLCQEVVDEVLPEAFSAAHQYLADPNHREQVCADVWLCANEQRYHRNVYHHAKLHHGRAKSWEKLHLY
ncbi:hypothetical protein AAVH_15100 [Aphelenchoides avenae]|nr:hypothetical protein AAVH_15100 [Aphelenchus avenae]